MFKVCDNQSETIFSDLFIRKESTNNFGRNRGFQIPKVNTVRNGTNSIRYFEPVIWDLVPSELK